MMLMYFIPSAAQVEDFLKQDRLLYPHCRYYIRQMRIHAYAQLLESYRSRTLQYMAVVRSSLISKQSTIYLKQI